MSCPPAAHGTADEFNLVPPLANELPRICKLFSGEFCCSAIAGVDQTVTTAFQTQATSRSARRTAF
jgi:hypothetical protein